MYRMREIEEALLHLVGWQQSFDPASQIDEDVTKSESGLYFQNQHPLLTLNNIKSVIPEDFIFQYPNWDSETIYPAGKVVHYGMNTKGQKLFWKARQESIGQIPSEDSLFWKSYNILSDYLERETKGGISTMVTEFLTRKMLTNETRNILENRALFDGAGRLAATIDNSGKICGYEITPVRSMGVTTKISRIGLQMTGAAGTVRIYIFHSNNINPYKVYDFEVTGQNGYQWFETPDLYLPYIGGEEKNAGGSWFVCYNQNDLPVGMQAIDITRDWSREPCGSCNKGDLQFWRELTKYLEVSPYKYSAPTDFKEYPEMWDIEDNVYTNTCNYGINLEVTVGCDLTDFIVRQRHIFANVLAKQVAYNVLREIAMNPEARVNRNQVNTSRMDILYELDGNTEAKRPGGLGFEIQKAYAALSLDTKGLDRVCLTCNNGGVRYTTT